MSKLKVTTIANVADSESTDVTNVINGSAKAWVNFDGTFGTSPFTVANGGIRAAFNVSSVTDNGTGNYTVNFTTPMSDANYCVQATGTDVTEAGVESAADMTTTTVKIRTHNSGGTTIDREVVSVAIFR
jgi:hypothetical protein